MTDDHTKPPTTIKEVGIHIGYMREDMNEQVVLAIVAILGTCLGGLIWVIKYLFKEVTPILRDLKKSVDLNTEQTKANEEYLKKRNGSDGRRCEENTQDIKNLTEVIKKRL